MSSGIHVDLPVKISIYRRTETARGVFRNPPGEVVSTIEVDPVNHRKGDYNPLKINFVVSPYRPRDFNKVVQQSDRKGNLSPYARSLFYSCFKNWEVEDE